VVAGGRITEALPHLDQLTMKMFYRFTHTIPPDVVAVYRFNTPYHPIGRGYVTFSVRSFAECLPAVVKVRCNELCLFYVSTSSELSNNKPTIWSRGNRKS